MQIIKRRDSIANICFYIGMLIHLMIMVVGYGDFGIPYAGRLLQVAFVFLCFKILMTYYTLTEWIVMLFLGGIGVLSYLFTRDEYVVSVVIMLFSCKNVDIYRFLKLVLWTALAGTVVTAVLSLAGIGGMAVDIRDYGRGGMEARWCLGFGHANNLHGTLWYLALLTLIVYFKKLKWYHYAGMTILNIVFYALTLSRSGLIAAQLVIIAGFILRYAEKAAEASWIYLLGLIELIGIVAVSIMAAMIPFEQYPVLAKMDQFVTGRFQLAYRYADIGQWKVISTGVVTDMVDNGWITIFFSYGYAIGILFIIFHVFLLFRSWKTKNGILLIMIMTSIFYTFMESSYTINSTYLLCNASYIVAMVLISGIMERRGFIDNGREKIERNGNSNISV